MSEKKRGKEKKTMYQILLCSEFIFRMFNSAQCNAFSVHFSIFFLHSKKIFPVLDVLSLFFSLSSFILDDLVANIFRHSNLDLQRANRMYQWKYLDRGVAVHIGRRHFFSAFLQNTFAQLVLISIYIPH